MSDLKLAMGSAVSLIALRIGGYAYCVPLEDRTYVQLTLVQFLSFLLLVCAARVGESLFSPEAGLFYLAYVITCMLASTPAA